MITHYFFLPSYNREDILVSLYIHQQLPIPRQHLKLNYTKGIIPELAGQLTCAGKIAKTERKLA